MEVAYGYGGVCGSAEGAGTRIIRVSYLPTTGGYVCVGLYVYTRRAGARMLAYADVWVCPYGRWPGRWRRMSYMGMFGVSPAGGGRFPRDTPNIPIRGVYDENTRMIRYHTHTIPIRGPNPITNSSSKILQYCVPYGRTAPSP